MCRTKFTETPFLEEEALDRRPAATRKTCVVHTRLGAYDDDLFDDDFCLLFEGLAYYVDSTPHNLTATCNTSS